MLFVTVFINANPPWRKGGSLRWVAMIYIHVSLRTFSKESPIFQLQVTFTALQESAQNVFNPIKLVESLHLRASEQQDAQEQVLMAHNIYNYETDHYKGFLNCLCHIWPLNSRNKLYLLSRHFYPTRCGVGLFYRCSF